ncbi:hypothetical protein KCH_47890 [Kitasatospora cheerisanensis KCTC 2395]|uniref:Uncharacterized protein n=1 Tax=Kitasatospora cheerisanensis KCTC 2395 TaxID=1348663 RepID=A0A066YQ01_9ACTN|nr:hypothetical protein KCH_47890 [Kitasatospora cheerisanensis KCTC 2395]
MTIETITRITRAPSDRRTRNRSIGRALLIGEGHRQIVPVPHRELLLGDDYYLT